MSARPDLRVIPGGGESSGPSRSTSDAAAQQVLDTMTGGAKTVHYNSLEEAHQALTTELGFAFVDKNTFGVLPGGFQLFYTKDHVLVRIKTKGTQIRPRPHMTISLTLGGTAWSQEQAKYNSRGRASAALMVRDSIANMPALGRLNADVTKAQQDDWANDCHFDFPPSFDDSAAATLIPGT